MKFARWTQLGRRRELSGTEMARKLGSAAAHFPISDQYELDYLPGEHWWNSQHEHVIAWFNEIDGPGAYKRRSRGLGAHHAYTHFQCASGLLWIAEAVHADPVVVQRAAEAAAGVGRPATQCAAIRRILPWQQIEALLLDL